MRFALKETQQETQTPAFPCSQPEEEVMKRRDPGAHRAEPSTSIISTTSLPFDLLSKLSWNGEDPV